MDRTFFFAIIALLFAVVCATPVDQERRQFGPNGGIINVAGIHVIITLESLLTNLTTVEFNVKNTSPTEFTIKSIRTSAGVNGTEYIIFNQTFASPGLIVPPMSNQNSGFIFNVPMVQGTLASLNIVSLGLLDILDTDAEVQEDTTQGQLGFPVSLKNLTQSNVPTKYDLALGFPGFPGLKLS